MRSWPECSEGTESAFPRISSNRALISASERRHLRDWSPEFPDCISYMRRGRAMKGGMQRL